MTGRGSVVTVGTFDGVHLGHQAVLREIRARAERSGRRSILVTFEPHPLEVVNPAAAPALLTTPSERMAILAMSGIDRMMTVRFDAVMAARSPAAFVDEVLVPRCDLRELVIGHDHGFGRGRQGDVATLQALGAERGFPVDVVAPVSLSPAAPVSSTAIRRAVAGGDLRGAARMLGRPYTVDGVVERGAARGRTIGFPTLNLGIESRKLLPPDGVYAVVVETPAGRFGGMMNQGHRPTFEDGQRVLEVHLFGFEGALYDRRVSVQWVAALRAICRFDDAAALRRQLEDDQLSARTMLAEAYPDLEAPLRASE